MSNMERNIKITPVKGVTVVKGDKIIDKEIFLVEIIYSKAPGKVFIGFSSKEDQGANVKKTDLSYKVQFSTVSLAKKFVVVNIFDLMVRIPLKTLITEEILENKGAKITRPNKCIPWIDINDPVVFELLFKSVDTLRGSKIFHEGSVSRSFNSLPIVVPYKDEEPLIDPDKVEEVQEEDIPEIKFNSDKVDEEVLGWDDEDQDVILEEMLLNDPYQD